MNTFPTAPNAQASVRRRPNPARVLALAAPPLLLVAIAHAGGLAIEHAVLSGGGAVSQSPGGCLAVTATIGHEPSSSSSSGAFVLEGGFWAGAGTLPGDALFNDGFQECL